MSKVLVFIVLIILGLLGNIFNIEMFFGVNQIFGSIFVLLGAWYFGPLLGTLAALIVHSYTIYLWGHPYAFIGFTLEALVVGLLLRKKTSNIFIADIIYWTFLGVWLVPLFYGYVMGLGEAQVELIMLKQIISGILNALIATVISLYLVKYIEKSKTIDFGNLLFIVITTLVVFALYLSGNIMTNKTFRSAKNDLITLLKRDAHTFNHEVNEYIEKNIEELKHTDNLKKNTFLSYVYKISPTQGTQLIFSSVDINSTEQPISLICANKPLLHVGLNSFQINILKDNECLVGGIHIEKFKKFLREEVLIDSTDAIVMRDNNILFSLNNTFNNNQHLGFKKYIEKNIYHIFPKQQMSKMAKWQKSFYVYEVNNKYFEHNKLLITKSLALFIDDLQQIYIFTFLLLLGTIFILTIVIYFVSSAIIKPLKELNKNSYNLSQKIIDKRKIQWPYTNIKEIMDLSNNFHTLTNTLKDIFQENHEHYEQILNSSKDSMLVINLQTKQLKNYNSMALEVFGKDILYNESIYNLILDEKSNVLNNKLQNIDTLDFRDKYDNIFTAIVESTYVNLQNEDIALLSIKDISQEIKTQDEIHQLAYFDSLTSLPNRSLFEDRIKHAISNAKRTKEIVALMFIDLDNFKIINDTLGHSAGDTLLKAVSIRIKSILRENDTLSRIGGDEFTLILENVSDKIFIASIAKKIIASLEKPFILDGKESFTAASIGICLYPDDANNMSDMMRKADTAMYKVKELGKNNFEFFTDEMNKNALEQLEMISDLKKALNDDVFQLYYQPKVCFKTGEILGAEALIRWIDPIKGFISPEIFINVAEQSGLMGQVEKFVLNKGAEQQLKWQKMGIDIQMSLNISNQQFNKSDFVGIVTTIFKQYHINPSTIDLELTERIVMGSQESFDKIKKLKDYGFHISLDDFGTGQSSLSYLKKYNIDTLKIDKSFINDLEHDEQSRSIATAIISLANAMNMNTVAEGVEDIEQLKILKALGCDTYQGWYFSKALPAKEFETLYFKTL